MDESPEDVVPRTMRCVLKYDGKQSTVAIDTGTDKGQVCAGVAQSNVPLPISDKEVIGALRGAEQEWWF